MFTPNVMKIRYAIQNVFASWILHEYTQNTLTDMTVENQTCLKNKCSVVNTRNMTKAVSDYTGPAPFPPPHPTHTHTHTQYSGSHLIVSDSKYENKNSNYASSSPVTPTDGNGLLIFIPVKQLGSDSRDS